MKVSGKAPLKCFRLANRAELEWQERILHVFIDVCKNTETVVSMEMASAVSPPAYIMQQGDI